MASEEIYDRRLTVFSIMPAIQFGLGLWLLASPYFLQYTLHGNARMNVGLVAPMVIAFALTRLAVTPRWFWVGWVNVLFGIWLVVSPFAFGLTHITDMTLNFVIVGALLILTGIAANFERVEIISGE